MSSLSKLKASLALATSDITLAAASINFDFSRFKVEAPASYHPLGKALSPKRCDDAEFGTPHATARRLGALFEKILPQTPTLMSAYGTRVSEISALLDGVTREIAVGSLFAAQTGPDGTTIWAAATSGAGAIAVHLLACMLAQAWSASEAISIWVELVEGRKLEIAEAFDRDSISDYSTLAATRSEITRAQLADWDASARAWVRVADNVKKPEISSLRLLLNDLKLDVTKGQQLYKNVVEV
jgi:hypothetical protein